MKKVCACGATRYPTQMSAYEAGFSHWRHSDNPVPYGSYGNGSAMRVSPVAWWLDTLAETLEEAEKTALPTQNHSEEVKGAKAVAHAIFTLRTRAGSGWQKIVSDACELYYPGGMKKHFKRGVFDEICMGTVPVAFQITARSEGFKDTIRNAISKADTAIH